MVASSLLVVSGSLALAREPESSPAAARLPDSRSTGVARGVA